MSSFFFCLKFVIMKSTAHGIGVLMCCICWSRAIFSCVFFPNKKCDFVKNLNFLEKGVGLSTKFSQLRPFPGETYYICTIPYSLAL